MLHNTMWGVGGLGGAQKQTIPISKSGYIHENGPNSVKEPLPKVFLYCCLFQQDVLFLAA